ncbi:hypothetical protein SY88_17870 [Clostridiales bacterium PH28_bin88]|nr:hypothetical protein SY88_17870 [Clostridiales bacterium PH28_bin88]
MDQSPGRREYRSAHSIDSFNQEDEKKRTMKKFFALLLILSLILLLVPAAGAQDADSLQGAEGQLVVVAPEKLRFEPTADSWRIAFSLLTGYDSDVTPMLKSITVNGVEAKDALANVPNQLKNRVQGMTMAQVARWNELRKAKNKAPLSAAEHSEFDELSQSIDKGLRNPEGNVELNLLLMELIMSCLTIPELLPPV